MNIHTMTCPVSSRCRAQGSGFRVQGAGFRAQGTRHKAQGCDLNHVMNPSLRFLAALAVLFSPGVDNGSGRRAQSSSLGTGKACVRYWLLVNGYSWFVVRRSHHIT